MSEKRAKITAENLEEARRLKALWEERPHMTQAEFGEHYELGNQSNVAHYLNGRSALNPKAAAAFAAELMCEVSDFSPRVAQMLAKMGGSHDVVVKTGIDEPEKGYIRLEHLSVMPSMGHGALAEPEHLVQHLDVLEQWVREEVGSTDARRIKVLTGNGRSMYPLINHRDLVFVDIGQRSIDAPGIYVLDVAGRLLLKKVLILSDGTLILRSENQQEYPDEERHDLRKMADQITICGKVKAWWTLRKG
jgi:hypothetical protein